MEEMRLPEGFRFGTDKEKMRTEVMSLLKIRPSIENAGLDFIAHMTAVLAFWTEWILLVEVKYQRKL
jgi:hypothetical protein